MVGIDLVQNAMFLSPNPNEVASKSTNHAPVIRLKMYICSTLISQLQDGSLPSLGVCSSETGIMWEREEGREHRNNRAEQ